MLLVPSEDPLLLRACLLCSNTNVGAYVEPSSSTRSQELRHTEAWFCSPAGPPLDFHKSRCTPSLPIGLGLMAHYRSRIGSLVGWGLPVTLGAPTPLLGSGKVHLQLGAQ